jgi:hypothetical protein
MSEQNSSDHDRRTKEQEKQRKRALQRLARYTFEDNWEDLETIVRDLQMTPEEEKESDSQATIKFHRLACQQARDSTGRATLERLFRIFFLYSQLNPQDGIDAALARVIPTLTETTMECFRRASVAEALPVRDLELNYALKGSLVLAALAKAWDGHREHMASSKKKKVGN